MDTGAVILTTFLSTIPVYLFFATGFYLRHKQVIQADHDGMDLHPAVCRWHHLCCRWQSNNHGRTV